MKFLLDTDSVSSVGSAITNISTSASSIADECNGYSTDCSEFDFTSAKSTIVSNVRNMADRIRNTSAIIEGIVAAHGGIQAYTFEQYLNPPKETEEDSSASGNRAKTGRARSRGLSSGSRHYSPGSTYEEPEQNIAEIIQEGAISTSDIIKRVSYAKVDSKNLSTESKAILKNAVKESGYMLIGGRYALACSSSIGKVGDVLRFKGSDGKEVQCVVTVNTVADNNKNKAYFLVDDKNKDLRPLELADILTNEDTKVKNLGNYTEVKPVETTIKTTVSKAAENVTAVAKGIVNPDSGENVPVVNTETQNNATSTETTKDNTPVDSNNTEGGVVNA